VKRFVGGRSRSYSTFAPLAFAAIGTASTLPLPLLHRSIMIHMERADGSRELKRLDKSNPDPALDAAYHQILGWVKGVILNGDPEMPVELRNRQADNWRPLLAIADAGGWGVKAREAAVAFAKDYQDEDAPVQLLRDIRDMFDARGVDRLSSLAIVEHLNGLDDAMWSEWRGLNGNQQPRPLSPSELAKILGLFRIRPRTIYFGIAVKSGKGYMYAWFARAWAAYCSPVRPSQHRNIKYLLSA
jgi:hypothetical protein